MFSHCTLEEIAASFVSGETQVAEFLLAAYTFSHKKKDNKAEEEVKESAHVLVASAKDSGGNKKPEKGIAEFTVLSVSVSFSFLFMKSSKSRVWIRHVYLDTST